MTLIAQARQSTNSPFLMNNGLLMRRVKNSMEETVLLIALPTELRKNIFRTAHALPFAGHLGKWRTAERIANGQDLEGMPRDGAGNV